MQEQGDCLDRPVHVGPLDTIEHVRPDACALMRRTTALNELQISSSPLLYESRGKRRGKAKDQTEEPQDVDPDSRGSGFK